MPDYPLEEAMHTSFGSQYSRSGSSHASVSGCDSDSEGTTMSERRRRRLEWDSSGDETSQNPGISQDPGEFLENIKLLYDSIRAIGSASYPSHCFRNDCITSSATHYCRSYTAKHQQFIQHRHKHYDNMKDKMEEARRMLDAEFETDRGIADRRAMANASINAHLDDSDKFDSGSESDEDGEDHDSALSKEKKMKQNDKRRLRAKKKTDIETMNDKK